MPNRKLRNDLREAYNRYAQEREDSTLPDWKIEERARVLSALQQGGVKDLLEIGAGTGRDSQYFQSQGFEVVCIDLSPVNVELCRQKGLTAHVMDMLDLDFPASSFDAVYSLNSLLHLTKLEFPKVLHRIASLLKEGGMAYIGMYGGFEHEGIWEGDAYLPKRFFSYFTDEHLKTEVSQVFDILTFNRVSFKPDDLFHFQSLLLKKKPARRRAD